MMAARSPISASEEKGKQEPPRRGSAPLVKAAPPKVTPKAATPSARPGPARMAHRTQAVNQLQARTGYGGGVQQQRVVPHAAPQNVQHAQQQPMQQQQQQQPQASGGGAPQQQVIKHAPLQLVAPTGDAQPKTPRTSPPALAGACAAAPTTGPESVDALATAIDRSARRGTMYFPPPEAVDADELPYMSEDDYDSDEESILSAEDEEIETVRGSVTVRFDNRDVELELNGDTPDPIVTPASYAEAREAFKEHVECGGSLHNRTVTKALTRTRTGQTVTAQLPPRLAASVMRAEREEREKSVIDGQSLPFPDYGVPRPVALPKRVGEDGNEVVGVSPMAGGDANEENSSVVAPESPHVAPGVEVATVMGSKTLRRSTGGTELKHITPSDIESIKTPLFLMGMTKGLAGVGGDEYVYDLGMTQLLEEVAITTQDDAKIKRSLKVARQGHASLAGTQSFWKAIADVYKRATKTVSGKDGLRAASLVLVLATARAANAIKNLVFASMGSIYHIVLVCLSAGKFIVDRVMGLKYRKHEPSTFKELRIAFKQRDWERLGFVLGTLINKFDPTPFNKFKDTISRYNQMINDRLITKSKSFFLMWVRATICAGAMSIAAFLPKVVKRKLVKQLHRWLRFRWYRVCQQHLPPNDDLCNAILREYVCGKRMSRIHKEYMEGPQRLLLMPPPTLGMGDATQPQQGSLVSNKSAGGKRRKGVKAKSLQVWSRWTSGPNDEPEPMRLYEAMQIDGGHGPTPAIAVGAPPQAAASAPNAQPVNVSPIPMSGAPQFGNMQHGSGNNYINSTTPPPGGYYAQQQQQQQQQQQHSGLKLWDRRPSAQARLVAPAPAPAGSTEPMRLYEALQMHSNAATSATPAQPRQQSASQKSSQPQAQSAQRNHQQGGQGPAAGTTPSTPQRQQMMMGVKM